MRQRRKFWDGETDGRRRRIPLLAAVLVCLLPAITVLAAAQSSAAATRRVAVWAPALNAGGRSFTDQTVRQVVHVTAGGTVPRVRLSNLKGTGTLKIGHVDLALRSSGGTAIAGSHHRVTFGGASSASLPAGTELVSDPVSMSVSNAANLLVSVYVSGTSGPTSWHPAAHETTYISRSGDHAADDSLSNYPTTTTSWYLVSRVDDLSTATGTLLAFGDSITDGTGSTTGANRRWPNYLAGRLAAVSGGPRLSVADAGIGGNRVLTDQGATQGDSGLHRFQHDAIGAGAVKDVIVLEGINDIVGGNATAAKLESAYRTMIAQAHAGGAKIYGATLTPFGGYTHYTSARESVRQSVNQWIRTSGAYDGVIDFDAAVRDPGNPSRIRAADDSGDHLHPNDAGYQAMANAVNLNALSY